MENNGEEKKIILKNKKAYFDYTILETYEAGVELKGTEIKSIRQGRTSFKDSYIDARKGELYVINWNISPYEKGGYTNHDPERPKKLLLHKKEIKRLIGKISQKGLTLIPLSIYLKGKYLKMEIALATGKKKFDKREVLAKRDAQREMERALKRHYH